MTSRRSFLAAAAAFALDPERALWVPGAKTISVPAARPLAFFLEVGDVVTFGVHAERYIVTAAARSMNEIAEARFKLAEPFYSEQMGYLPVEGLYSKSWPQIALRHARRA